MTTRAKIQSYLECYDQEAILLEPEMYDDAIIGIVNHPDGSVSVAYDRQQCIEIIMADSRCTREEANEYYEYNTVRACCHMENGPLLVDTRYAE